uniref:Uncharacterized protein n=1 Tax=Arundo donax TaxID=35708 RepID=A0A0A9GMX6_ARUDO
MIRMEKCTEHILSLKTLFRLSLWQYKPVYMKVQFFIDLCFD